MEKNLKDRSYYENLYDHHTIRIMKNLEKINLERAKKWNKFIWEFSMLMEKYNRYEHRNKTIEERIQRDTKRDEFYENTKEPFETIRCRLCNQKMILELKDLDIWVLWKKDRILFIYRCEKCRKWRAFYNDWSEFETTKEKCKKCNNIIDYRWSFEWKIYTKNYNCNNCWIQYTEKEDYSIQKDEEDIITQEDINKYWYNKKDELETEDFHNSLYNLKEIILDRKDEKKEQEEKEKLSKIKKYNFLQIEDLITKWLENTEFTNFKIIKNETIKTYLKCEFQVFYKWTVSNDTIKKLEKILNDILTSSNWKLQKYKTTEKLWILTWYIFWYDNKEDLLKLV